MSDVKTCPTCGTEYPLSERFCPRDGTALRGSNPLGDLVGSIVHDKFHVMKKLGEGGMGAVYLAEHVKMGKKMALKVMNPGMHQDADAIARFNREAKNASQINHPNVCAIYDFGETSEGLIYLAMEFIEGSSLSGLIEKNGALGAPRAAAIIHQAADALQVAHDYGIVHRDLKPDNIMITKARDGSDQVKVVDFGIAKASSSDAQKVTKTGLVVGTPEYMSPEQLAGDKLDGRSDIYSLGLVAFNCLTGTLPFPSNSAQEAMIMRLTDQPKTLAEMKPEIAWPEELQTVMTKALERDANERYQSAAEFGRHLSKAVENMPHTMIADAGTQVMGAGAAVAAAAARTAAAPAVPKTRLAPKSATPESPVVPVEPQKKSGMPMGLVAGVAVVVIGVGGYFVMQNMNRPADPGATPPVASVDSGKAAAPPSTPNPQTNDGSKAAPGSKGNGRGQTPDPNSGRGGTTPPVGGGGAPAGPDPAQVITALEAKLDDPSASKADGQRALGEIDAILPKVSGAQLGSAYFLQSIAYGLIEEDAKACGAARKAKDLLPAGSKQRRVDMVLGSDACK